MINNSDELCAKITDVIYSSCKKNKVQDPVQKEGTILRNQNCSSQHYFAIAEANFKRYEQLLLENKDETEYSVYLKTWVEAEQLGRVHKEEELNVQVNVNWNKCKSDGRSLWKAIDWKGKSVKEKTEDISADTIHRYFKEIFQSPKTRDNPTLDMAETYENNVHVDELDGDMTIEELNGAMKEIGTGTSLDGLAPDILKVIPMSLRMLILQLFNMVFSSTYPTVWRDQLLLPHSKKGHCPAEPKLRGIGIGALLSRIYDKILNKRFLTWYIPNKEQAGFRKLMGCLLQIFCIYLLMELANDTGNDIYIAFMDYEKAFDFLNRKRLMEKLCQKQAGKRFTQAIHNMYQTTAYIPKISTSKLGDKISTDHGVTQGKESSANLYSFYVSDMSSYLNHYTTDFRDPLNLVQLADDTATMASLTNSLCQKIRSLFSYSDDNFQIANVGKTKYLHLSLNPFTDPLQIDENQYVESAHKKGYIYLGMLFICSNRMRDQIIANINDRMWNINKFYAWLQYNASTPIEIKLLALYNCVFMAILYGAETWGDITSVSEKILLFERQALKRCLGVKSSTPDNLLYLELNRSDIVASIRDSQCRFFLKLLSLEDGTAIVRDILELCKELSIVKYYQNLHTEHKELNLDERKASVMNSPETYTKRYRELTNLEYCSALYDTFMREDLRIIITRWRLSCFDLAIETGRYHGIARQDRLCVFCDVLEDEHHAIFDCTAYVSIREQYQDLLQDNPSVNEILNPKSKEMTTSVGTYLKLIEAERKSLL